MYIQKAALCKKGTKQIKGYKKEKSKRTKKEINYKEEELISDMFTLPSLQLEAWEET